MKNGEIKIKRRRMPKQTKRDKEQTQQAKFETNMATETVNSQKQGD